MKLLVIGSLNMDLVADTSVFPKPGETVFGDSFATVCGGKGGNQAIAAAKLGADVTMIAGIGNDVFGSALKKNLEECSVKTDGVTEFKGVSSGIATIIVSGGENRIILNKGSNYSLTPEIIDDYKNLIAECDALLFQFEIPMETVIYAASLGKAMGKKILVNPAPICEIPKDLLNLTDLLIPNEHEAAGILGYEVNEKNCKQAANDLLKLGCSEAIITMGGFGSVYANGKETLHCGIFKTSVADTTAAGDSFTASFNLARSEGKTPSEALQMAAVVSGIVVSRKGASTSIPSRNEIDSVINSPDFKAPHITNL